VAARTEADVNVRLGDVFGRLGARRADARRLLALARSCRRSHDADREASVIALLAATADVFARRALDHPWRRSDVARTVSTICDITGLPGDVVRAEIHARMATDPRIVQLSPAVAVETELKILYALTTVESASLWVRDPLAGLTSRFQVGRLKRERSARTVAGAVLEGGQAEESGSTQGIPVLRWQRPDGVLVVEGSADDAPAAASAGRVTCAALALVLERQALLVRSTARERALVEPRERLLTRLGFDLHDGPIQDVAALAGDIRLLRTQFQDVLGSGASSRLVGRLDDLEARVGAIDNGLRQMVHSLESPGVTRQPLDVALGREVAAFAEETDLPVDCAVRGDVTSLTDSQRIAIVRIVQESLTNIREHADASHVSIAVTAGPSEITVEVNDDGRGFDVDRTLVRSVRAGRLGLLGMSERIRLLGGRFDVRSRPGGPTAVSVVIPAWQPATLEPAAVAESGSAV
jgi:signal transduction histidine kinase